MRCIVVLGVSAALAFGSPGRATAQQAKAPEAAGEVAPVAKKSPAKKAAKAKAAAPKAPIVEAKAVFGAMASAAPLAARAIGFYSRGCLAGAKPLPIDGPTWQAMRLSRNRNWGHPELVGLVEKLSADAKALDGWPGLLVGDLAQPRGGPMLSGHASHQVGLDADIWLTPMPDRRLSREEREELGATSMIAAGGALVDPAIWTEAHAKLILRAASYAEVERIFVHPGIKKALCLHPGAQKAALTKIRPYWGHDAHMHIRIPCPKDSTGCRPQPPLPNDDGCGKDVENWLALMRRPSKPPVAGAKPAAPKPGIGLEELPAECRAVVDAGSPTTEGEIAARALTQRLSGPVAEKK